MFYTVLYFLPHVYYLYLYLKQLDLLNKQFGGYRGIRIFNYGLLYAIPSLFMEYIRWSVADGVSYIIVFGFMPLTYIEKVTVCTIFYILHIFILNCITLNIRRFFSIHTLNDVLVKTYYLYYTNPIIATFYLTLHTRSQIFVLWWSKNMIEFAFSQLANEENITNLLYQLPGNNVFNLSPCDFQPKVENK